MNKMYHTLIILTLAAALLGGCAKENTPEIQESIPAAGAEDDTLLETTKTEDETQIETTSAEDETLLKSEASALKISFEGTDLEGNTVTSDVLSQTKLTMVNVWATYCNPCLSEMPGLGELAEEYDAEEFQIIGIISDVIEGENQELAESLIEQTGANYTHLLLNESLFYALLTDVSAVPTTFFIDQNGVILDTIVGAMDKSAWEEKINALLEEM